ncbi:MAG TPA: phytoene/squalene synthase family protein [Terracidiphilus sp.]|nr:phytoene/squalene synthase family protein [Terracidiphilus sp.]
MTQDSTLAQAYAVCRAIAKREAKNFYYSFVALPAERRDAICAIYAFMRKADDLSDDESIPLDERRKQMAAWREQWRQTAAGSATNDPVFLAVRDAIARFNIPLALLEELIDGTTMDLERAPGSADSPDTYATFEDLYRYCYLVASVVGLVCIRIFGYSDKRAEKLAEETGIAFQLTNILRDVAEDASRNRVYLPLDELSANGVSIDGLVHRQAGSAPSAEERALLASIGARAEKYYQSAQELLPLIDKESRPALWVLVRIYRRLLIRIKDAEYDVFSRRVAVPTYQKLEILAVGMTRMALVRIFG